MTMEPEGLPTSVDAMEIAIRQAAADNANASGYELAARLSFEEFWHTERSNLARALAVTLGDVQLAAEATDEAMARAFQHWDRVSTLDSPAGWTYRVGLNWSRSVLRRLQRRPPVWLAQPTTHLDAPTLDPSIAGALQQLSAAQRSVVVCRLLLNLSEQQTATLLRIRPGTVKSRLARSIILLAGALPHFDPKENQS